MTEAVTAEAMPIPHAFFTRRGGVSTGPYSSLNCSLSGQDNRDSVLRNRARAAQEVGADPVLLLGLNQVHGADVVTIRQPWAVGEGPRADAMVTAQRGLALGIVTADCAPVLFADPGRRIVGAAHAGWRGAVAGVLEATIAAMVDLGALPEHLTAAIGPCIAQASYEVGADLRDAVLHRCAADSAFFLPGARTHHWHFDLPGYCASRLRAAGVGNVIVTGFDTCADEARFFSHRRRTLAHHADQGKQPGHSGTAKLRPIGHQISIVTLTGT